MNNLKRSTYKIGLRGEQAVYESLPNAHWITLNRTWNKNWDIEWEGIKIEVKTSTSLIERPIKKLKRFSFLGIWNEQKNLSEIFVFVGIDEEKKYFWIEKASNLKSSYSGKLENAILDSKELPSKIKQLL